MTHELNSRDECPPAAHGGPVQRGGDGLRVHECGRVEVPLREIWPLPGGLPGAWACRLAPPPHPISPSFGNPL